MYFTSLWIFEITSIAHTMLLGEIIFTVLNFKTAKRNLRIFGIYYTPSSSRTIYLDEKIKELDPNDKGREHD